MSILFKTKKQKFDTNISIMLDILLKRLDDIEIKIDALADSEIDADIDREPIIVVKGIRGML